MNCSDPGCGEPIRRGTRYVTITRNIEREDPGPGNVTVVEEAERLEAFHLRCAPTAGQPDRDESPRLALRLFAAVLLVTCASVAFTTTDTLTRVMFAIAAVALPAVIEVRIWGARRGRE